MVRGEAFRLPSPRQARGREQRGARYGVVVQSDELLDLSTILVAPTSRSARPATFRPPIRLGGAETRVLVEQTAVVDPERLGRSAGRLEAAEMSAVDEALRLVLGL
ncbi:MAG: type II toxin-antitoxin system PemK/MazF family toxin [Thermoleophilaceae bacterium]